MVKGMELFREHFSDYTEYFMLIGGSACELTLMNAGGFRATKDIDILIALESMDRRFAARFQDFLQLGRYKCYVSKDERCHFYRFLAPKGSVFPQQLELLSRSLLPEYPELSYTPLTLDKYVQSMSAIILNDVYYKYALSHRVMRQDLPCLDTEGLIAFKSAAYLNLLKLKAEKSESVRSHEVYKHRNDIFRLVMSIFPDATADPPAEILSDLRAFIECFPIPHTEWKAITNSLGLPETMADALRKRYTSYFKLD